MCTLKHATICIYYIIIVILGGAVKDVHDRIKLILKPLDFSIFESFPALIHGRWFGFGLTW